MASTSPTRSSSRACPAPRAPTRRSWARSRAWCAPSARSTPPRARAGARRAARAPSSSSRNRPSASAAPTDRCGKPKPVARDPAPGVHVLVFSASGLLPSPACLSDYASMFLVSCFPCVTYLLFPFSLSACIACACAHRSTPRWARPRVPSVRSIPFRSAPSPSPSRAEPMPLRLELPGSCNRLVFVSLPLCVSESLSRSGDQL